MIIDSKPSATSSIDNGLKQNIDRCFDSFTLCVLASGSKGNAIYVSNGKTSLLFDAGLTGVEIERRFATLGIFPNELDAIVVSHEHADHIRGVGVLSRRFDLPVYINEGTYKEARQKLGAIRSIKNFRCGASFKIDNLTIHPFSISHDVEDPSGFTVVYNEKKIGIATDLGKATALVKEHLKGCAVLVIEANHDLEMLEKGPYPWHLKQRIKGRTGHLSNTDSNKLLKEIKSRQLKHVILAHLSDRNNLPEKALHEVGAALESCETELSVALQERCGKLVMV